MFVETCEVGRGCGGKHKKAKDGDGAHRGGKGEIFWAHRGGKGEPNILTPCYLESTKLGAAITRKGWLRNFS